MAYWRCPAGDFTAANEREKTEHMKEMAKNKSHQDMLAKKAEDKGRNVVDDIKDQAKDLWHKIT